ncbi:methyltransferase domain-containing protein [Amycolatopsis sp. cmx-11-51]|uniref:methyltransferase domain-containing protein n=1 Tax=Amycolatopsis sp. cmx-11-51 TaxID=2785797 RepID=UPI0039E70AAE
MTTSTTSTGPDSVPDWQDRSAALADDLIAAGKLTSPQWRAAVENVPRHVFVPRFYLHRDGRMVALAADDPDTRQEWADTVYSNIALVTLLDQDENSGPVFLSSSSTPGLMTRMLEALDVHDGHTVLEIGTGTGLNAAWLTHRLGDKHVYSIDIEPDLVDTARARLAQLGYRPTLVTGDGAAGLPGHAPFDRIIATCSVPSIPWPWIEQTRVGGRILTDVRAGTNAGNLVHLTRTASDRAEGRFDAHSASFMGLRHTPGSDTRIPYTRSSSDSPTTTSTTTRDPQTPWTHPVVWFLAALRIGGRYQLGYTGNPQDGPPRAAFITTPDGSRADITLAPDDRGRHDVAETGPVRLWQHVEHAHQLWDQAGRPPWHRLGLLVTRETQTIYTDTSDTPLATLAATPST